MSNDIEKLKAQLAQVLAENEALKNKRNVAKVKRIEEISDKAIWKRCSYLGVWFIVREENKNRDFGGGGANSGRYWNLGDICRIGNRARNAGVKNERGKDALVMARLVECGDIGKKAEIEAEIDAEIDGVEKMRIKGRKEVFKEMVREGREQELEKNGEWWEKEIVAVRMDIVVAAIKANKIEFASIKEEIKQVKDAARKKELAEDLAAVEAEIKELNEKLKVLKGGDKDVS